MNEGASSGIGLGGVLFCIFLVLKLTGFIDWSWWWISAPLWGPVVFVAALVLFVLLPIAFVKALKS